MSMIRTETVGAVRRVIFSREEKRNAMNVEFVTELDAALLEAQNDSSIHCVILSGDGPMFSAGVDIASLNDFSAGIEGLRPAREVMMHAANRCEEMTKPVIVQAHGAVIGLAMEISLACDMRICTEETFWSLPETKIGLIPDVGGSTRLPAIVGLGRAKEMIMTSKVIDGREAERIGLVNRAVPAGQLEEATQELIDQLLACSPIAVGLAKRVMDGVARPTLATSLEFEVTAQTVCASTEDFKEGAAAALERRQPEFKGR